MTKYRAVLWDSPPGQPGGGAPDSDLPYEKLLKTEWRDSRELAEQEGNTLNLERCGGDYYVRIEEK